MANELMMALNFCFSLSLVVTLGAEPRTLHMLGKHPITSCTPLPWSLHFSRVGEGPREMAQLLAASAVLAEDLSSSPSTHVVTL